MQQRQTGISTWADRVMEACWLAALIMVPIYFNLLSARHFEPDKAIVLRGLMLVLLAAWGIKVLERGQVFGEWPRWRDWRGAPMLVPIAIYAAVFILSTIVSTLPGTSLWGGYNRLQGTYTNLSYIVMALAIIANLRRREQFERLVTVIILTALPVTGYAIIQHQGADPLPWKGDVISRVASTMGNSIFVSAYLILVVPFVLYRLVQLVRRVANPAPLEGENAPLWLDVAWGIALLLLICGQLAIFNGVLKMGSLIYTTKLSVWWLYPFVVLFVGSSFVLVTTRIMSAPRSSIWPYAPGIVLILLLLGMLLQGLLTAPNCPASGSPPDLCLQQPQSAGDYKSHAADYQTWLLWGYTLVFLFYLAVALLPRRAQEAPSRVLAGMGVAGLGITLVMLAQAIIFTQSRGPWLGALAGIVVFVTLTLIQGLRTPTSPRIRKALMTLLVLWIGLGVAFSGFIAALNASPDSFASLRSQRYISRLSNLLETEGGTGEVRMLIWRGDEVTRGAVGLILSEPLRTFIGWGPEAMFVAYNPFYPPDLAHLESRGASPDRSHQALLDELVHKGALGLFSHLFLYYAFSFLMFRFLQIPRWVSQLLLGLFTLGVALFFTWILKSTELGIIALISGAVAMGLAAWLGYDRPVEERFSFVWQVFFIACLAVLVSNFVETFFGIPIVSTLTYMWTTIGLAVAASRLAGGYDWERQPEAAVVEEPVVAQAAPAPQPAGKQKAGAQGRAAVAAAKTKTMAQQRTRQGRAATARRADAVRWIYLPLGLLALLGVWFLNLRVAYADMRFNQGQQWSNTQAFEQQLIAYTAYRNAIDLAPDQDFYYLYYGRSILTLAQLVGPKQNELAQKQQLPPLDSTIRPVDSIRDLPTADYNAVVGSTDGLSNLARWFLTKGPYKILNYSRLAMEHARDLNPTNKDHYANLGRINGTWYSSLKSQNPPQLDPTKLDAALASYQRAVEIAPQDVALMGQWGMMMQQKDPAEAERILKRALELDPIFADNHVRLGEIYLRGGNLAGAAGEYKEALRYNGTIIGRVSDVPTSLDQLKKALAADPQQLRVLAEGYQQYVDACDTMAQPRDQLLCKAARLDAQYNRVVVISDTLDFQTALTEAQWGLQIAQEATAAVEAQIQKDAYSKQALRFTGLVDYLQKKAPPQ